MDLQQCNSEETTPDLNPSEVPEVRISQRHIQHQNCLRPRQLIYLTPDSEENEPPLGRNPSSTSPEKLSQENPAPSGPQEPVDQKARANTTYPEGSPSAEPSLSLCYQPNKGATPILRKYKTVKN